MASRISFVISGVFLVIITIAVQSAPIEKTKTKQTIQSNFINKQQPINQDLLKPVDSMKIPSISTNTETSPTITTTQDSLLSTTTKYEKNDNKKKRYINDDDDDDRSDELLDDEMNDDSSSLKFNDKVDHTLYTEMKEIPATIHDNADKPIDTDDSNIFSDIQMNPNELKDILRRRRNVKLNDELNRRRKRALSPYDFYNTDSFYDPYADLYERNQYARPIRSFAPLYWYPTVYERNIRSALAPSFYEPSEWATPYLDTNDDEEIDESPISLFDDGIDDENNYDLNRYPILLESSNNPLDNLQLQQQYNIDDLPIDDVIVRKSADEDDEDDDDDDGEQYRVFYQKERPYYAPYAPIETYF